MASSGEVAKEEAALARWWNDLRERGSDVTIVGIGARKRIVKNSGLMSMIYFLRRWVSRGRKSRARRRYGNSATRLYRLRVLTAVGEKGTFASLKYWLHRMSSSCKCRKQSVRWTHSEDHAKIQHTRKRLMLSFQEFCQYHSRNSIKGGSKRRHNRLREYLAERKITKLRKAIRFWALMSRSERNIKRGVFGAMRDNFRLHKLSLIWKKMVLKEAFFRLLRRGRWPTVQEKYVATLKIPQKLSFWHILTLLRSRMEKVNKIGNAYFVDRKLYAAFKALRDREAFHRKRRIEGYVMMARRRMAMLAKYVRKLASLPDPRLRRLKARRKEKCDHFRFASACGIAVKVLIKTQLISVLRKGLERRGVDAYHRRGLRGGLEEWQAFIITKKRHRRLLHKAVARRELPLLRMRRAWAGLQRRRLYAFVYRNDSTLANVLFFREYFRQFKLTMEGIFLDRLQGEQARNMMLNKKRTPTLSAWRQHAQASKKLKCAVRHFNLVHKVKRRWFVRHFTHVRLQHRVRMAATHWHSRKVCKAVIKTLVHRLRASRRDAQRVRTFRVLCPVPQCSFAPQVFHAWKMEFVPRARRLRLSAEAVAARNHDLVAANVVEHWSHLYFHEHNKKVATRTALRHLIQLVVRRRAAWHRAVASCTSERLSALEKNKLSEVMGKHRLALRCGDSADIESTFMRAISAFGHKATGAFGRFTLQSLLRVQHLRHSKLRFVALMRCRRAFIAWARDYTASSREARLRHIQNYATVARRAANYREAALTAEEMGKFAVVMRIFFRWRDPLRRRHQALGKLLRKTRARKYMRHWYLIQRKSYVDRALPLSALSRHHHHHYEASSQGFYNTEAHISRSRSTSPGVGAGRVSMGSYSRQRSSAHPWGGEGEARGRSRHHAHAVSSHPHRSHSQPQSFSSSLSFSPSTLSSSISAPLTERAAQLATELQRRLRAGRRATNDGNGDGDLRGQEQEHHDRNTVYHGSNRWDRGQTAAQRGMSYDRERREKIRIGKQQQEQEHEQEQEREQPGGAALLSFAVHQDGHQREDSRDGGSAGGRHHGENRSGRKGPFSHHEDVGSDDGKNKENALSSLSPRSQTWSQSPVSATVESSIYLYSIPERKEKEKEETRKTKAKSVRWSGLSDRTNAQGGPRSPADKLISKIF